MDTSAAIDRFLAHGGLSESTQRAYGADLRAFSAWLAEQKLTLGDVDARVLSDWVGALGTGRHRLAPGSIARRLAAVRSCLRYTFGPATVPDAQLSPSRQRRLPDAPKPAEVVEILEVVDGDTPLALRNRALLELLYSAGLRSAEAVALDLGDVDFERELVHVRGKGGKERVVPLGEEAALHVARYLEHGRPALATGANDALFLPCAAAASIPRRCGGCCGTRTVCATPSRRTFSKEAPTCVSSRNFSGMRRCRRRRSTATSTRAACGAFTTTRTRAASRV